MGQKEKLIERLKAKPKTFTFDDAESLLRYFGYERSNKGRTSGSRIVFVSEQYPPILMHKPHPRKELLEYQVKQLIQILETGGTSVNNTMEYKGYVGSVEFSEEDGLFYGKVMGIRALISYEGSTAAELVNDFHGAVDDYLALCEEKHTEPERAYKGSFNVRISPELHKQAVIFAMAHNMSLNSLVENSIEQAVHAG